MDDEPLHIAEPPARTQPPRAPASAEVRGRPGRRSRLRQGVVVIVVAALVGAGIYLATKHSGQPTTARSGNAGPLPVGVAPVTRGDMPITLTGLGTVTPLATVTVQSQISGQLTEVGFRQGEMVQKGQFLAQIDPRPYQVALEQAQGQLAKDEAFLANARRDLARYDTLVAQNSVARQTRDTQASLVQQYEATIQSDKAQIDAQKLNLAYCHIVAPVAGRVGLRLVDPGNYIQVGQSTGIVVITQMDPMSVIFSIPENSLSPVLARLRAGAGLTAYAYDQTESELLATGKLEAVDNQINTTTGTVNLRAIFANPKDLLFPNQFVNVRLLVDTLKNTLLVPTAAVQRGAPGTYVYLVEANNTVKVQPIKLGPAGATDDAVNSGLSAGDRVVVDGADRLRAGAKVQVVAPPAGKSAAAAAAQPPGSAPQH
ncbi:MAG TPA: MdtA/MuxA family multidrug efflux RND transporter periplasmic adaptor subunit [Stellaceae bacterium]|nr:MdtA/MuxA family multidrug efflux RND transporter periplasmic adaptor subunit [Stellaceae bacterium]